MILKEVPCSIHSRRQSGPVVIQVLVLAEIQGFEFAFDLDLPSLDKLLLDRRQTGFSGELAEEREMKR